MSFPITVLLRLETFVFPPITCELLAFAFVPLSPTTIVSTPTSVDDTVPKFTLASADNATKSEPVMAVNLNTFVALDVLVDFVLPETLLANSDTTTTDCVVLFQITLNILFII